MITNLPIGVIIRRFLLPPTPPNLRLKACTSIHLEAHPTQAIEFQGIGSYFGTFIYEQPDVLFVVKCKRILICLQALAAILN